MTHTSDTRRKLLRGTLSAPLVLTVSSAGAAITSFARAYVPNPGTGAAPAIVSAASSQWNDSWYRIVLSGSVYVDSSCKTNNQKYAVTYVILPTMYGGTGTYWRIPTTMCAAPGLGYVYGTPQNTGLSTLPNAAGNVTVKPAEVAVLAFFNSTDPTGTPTSIAMNSTGSTIANKSIYASVMP